MSSFLKLEKRKVVQNGKEIKLKGVNFGNWLLIEHYMIGLPWVEHKIRERFKDILGEEKYYAFFNAYLENYITEDDFKLLKEIGLNFIRLPFNYRHFEDDKNPGIYKKEGFKYIDKVIELCKKYDMYVLLDLHAVVGAQAPDWNADSRYGESFFWEQSCFQERVANLWKFIAEYYVNEPRVFGYEIINEPVIENDIETLNNFYEKVINKIREVDKNHIIVLDSNMWATDISSLDNRLFRDPNVMPTFHHYHNHDFPFAVLKKYPGYYKGKYYDKEELTKFLIGKYDENRIERPNLAGEFGIRHKTAIEAQYNMLAHLLEFFNEKNFLWTMWCYKDIGVLGFVYPKENTKWMKFIQSKEITKLRNPSEIIKKFIFKKFKYVDKYTLERKFIREIIRDWHPIALDMILNTLKNYSTEDLKEMAQSFHINNCEINEKSYYILKKYASE